MIFIAHIYIDLLCTLHYHINWETTIMGFKVSAVVIISNHIRIAHALSLLYIHRAVRNNSNPTLGTPADSPSWLLCVSDECNDPSDCEENEQCTYHPMSSRYECTCNLGFSLVDDRCVRSDCSANPSQCHTNAQCVSGDDGYKCVCISGYHGDGIHQCVETHIGCDVTNNCGRNAVCGQNQTSANFVCICKPVRTSEYYILVA